MIPGIESLKPGPPINSFVFVTAVNFSVGGSNSLVYTAVPFTTLKSAINPLNIRLLCVSDLPVEGAVDELKFVV